MFLSKHFSDKTKILHLLLHNPCEVDFLCLVKDATVLTISLFETDLSKVCLCQILAESQTSHMLLL